MAKSNSLFGVFLVFAGLFLLLERLGLIDGDIFLLLLGSSFIVAYFITGHLLGMLIPGALLSWLGIYTVAIEQTYYPIIAEYSGGLLFLSLGLAFFSIFFHTLRYNKSAAKYWPIYPGISLIAFALIVEFEFAFIPQTYLEYIRLYWPAGLIILGVVIFLVSSRKKDEAK